MKILVFSVSVLMFLVAGCVHTPVQPSDARVTLGPGLGSIVYVTSVRCARNQAGYCLFQANVVNNTNRQVRLEYKVQWLDEAGMEIESVLSTWQPLAVQPAEIKGLSAVSPVKEAVDFRFYARPFGR